MPLIDYVVIQIIIRARIRDPFDDFDFGLAASSTSVFISTERKSAKDHTNYSTVIESNDDIVQEREVKCRPAQKNNNE